MSEKELIKAGSTPLDLAKAALQHEISKEKQGFFRNVGRSLTPERFSKKKKLETIRGLILEKSASFKEAIKEKEINIEELIDLSEKVRNEETEKLFSLSSDAQKIKIIIKTKRDEINKKKHSENRKLFSFSNTFSSDEVVNKEAEEANSPVSTGKRSDNKPVSKKRTRDFNVV